MQSSPSEKFIRVRCQPLPHRFPSVIDMHFQINVVQMLVDRGVADVKFLGDFLVKQP